MKFLIVSVLAGLLLSASRGYGATKTWTGAGDDNLASNAANWDGGVPVSGDDVVLDGATEAAQKSVTWDAGMNGVKLASWTQDGYTNAVVFETVFPDKGEFNAVMITGDVSLNSGSWTTPFNFTGAIDKTHEQLKGDLAPGTILVKYSLRANIGGSLTIGENAMIDVIGKGYPRKTAPHMSWGQKCSNFGGSYGGPGGDQHADHRNYEPYGSITEPIDLGCGGNWGFAGGAAYLVVSGETILSGSIKADAYDNNHYPGSGGSVYLKTGTISGKGKITSNSKQNGNTGGSGGRIAVILTANGANWNSFDIVNQAEAVCVTSKSSGYGMSGTIYAETPDNRKDHGWLIMKGNGRPMLETNRTMRICVSGYNVCDFDRITLTNSAVARFDSGETLVLTNTVLEVADKDGILNGFRFCGGKVHVEGNTFTQKTFVDVYNAISPAEDGVTYEVAAGSKLLLCDTVTFADSIINNGIIELDSGNLKIKKNFTNNGTLTMDNDSTFEFTGEDESVITGNSTFSTLLCYEAGKVLSFAPNSVQSVSKAFTVSITDNSPIVLKSTTPGSAWKLNVNNGAAIFVQGANVSDSDASGGQTIMAYRSTDGGNNINWNISADAPANSWIGTAGTAFEDGANWTLGTPPANGEKLVIASANPITISSDITFSDVTISAGADVTIKGNVSVTGDVEISDATVVWDTPAIIDGNLIINNGGLITHSANEMTEIYKLNILVKGNVVINEGGSIDVSSKGFVKTSGDGGVGYGLNPKNNNGASHGGRGHPNGAGANDPLANVLTYVSACYGSVYCPTNIGTGGQWRSPGGGAVKLVAEGALTLNGVIKANGGAPVSSTKNHYDGTGGSVWVTAASLAGSGEIQARNYQYESAGGRVAVYLTDMEASFDDFNGTIDAKAKGSSAGTVYLETAKQGPKGGTLYIKNPNEELSKMRKFTDIPSSSYASQDEFDRSNRTTLSVSDNATALLTGDCHIGDLKMSKGNSCLQLNGHTLYIHTMKHKLDINENQIIPGGTEEEPGKIVWTVRRTVLILR